MARHDLMPPAVEKANQELPPPPVLVCNLVNHVSSTPREKSRRVNNRANASDYLAHQICCQLTLFAVL